MQTDGYKMDSCKMFQNPYRDEESAPTIRDVFFHKYPVEFFDNLKKSVGTKNFEKLMLTKILTDGFQESVEDEFNRLLVLQAQTEQKIELIKFAAELKKDVLMEGLNARKEIYQTVREFCAIALGREVEEEVVDLSNDPNVETVV